jgi:hypothetical protein
MSLLWLPVGVAMMIPPTVGMARAMSLIEPSAMSIGTGVMPMCFKTAQ